ncbi:hypothetical protein CHUAL_003847 [Chamberlinius hualienensis]
MARSVKLLYGIKAAIAFIFMVFISPIIFGVYLMFWLWSKFVSHFLAKTSSKLDGQDVMPCVSDYQQSSTINTVVILKGKFTVEMMQQLFISRVINAKDENDKPLLPKFTQCIVEHCDYWFWKPKKKL